MSVKGQMGYCELSSGKRIEYVFNCRLFMAKINLSSQLTKHPLQDSLDEIQVDGNIVCRNVQM